MYIKVISYVGQMIGRRLKFFCYLTSGVTHIADGEESWGLYLSALLNLVAAAPGSLRFSCQRLLRMEGT